MEHSQSGLEQLVKESWQLCRLIYRHWRITGKVVAGKQPIDRLEMMPKAIKEAQEKMSAYQAELEAWANDPRAFTDEGYAHQLQLVASRLYYSLLALQAWQECYERAAAKQVMISV